MSYDSTKFIKILRLETILERLIFK